MGQTWVDVQEITDEILAPAADFLVSESKAVAPRAVLYIGCGNGATTRAIAHALPGAEDISGNEISEAMMGHAQAPSDAKSKRATFVAADAGAFSLSEEHMN